METLFVTASLDIDKGRYSGPLQGKVVQDKSRQDHSANLGNMPCANHMRSSVDVLFYDMMVKQVEKMVITMLDHRGVCGILLWHHFVAAKPSKWKDEQTQDPPSSSGLFTLVTCNTRSTKQNNDRHLPTSLLLLSINSYYHSSHTRERNRDMSRILGFPQIQVIR